MANSTRISGIDQSSRNTNQATRNEPPPFVAATRGNRQMLPVPTAMPSMATIMPQRVVKCSRAPSRCLLGSRLDCNRAQRKWAPFRGVRPDALRT
jgi:hypothetical protein